MRDCNSCAEKCPQAELAHQAALGRMYATNELVAILKKVESGELIPVVHGVWERSIDNDCPMHKCSVCGARVVKGLYEYENPNLYCYHCGAKMDGERRGG